MCMHSITCMFTGTCMRVCDFAAETNVAEGNGEAGGEGGVTKLLEQQTLEDKEREDGEEGRSSSLSLFPSLHHHHPHHQLGAASIFLTF